MGKSDFDEWTRLVFWGCTESDKFVEMFWQSRLKKFAVCAFSRRRYFSKGFAVYKRVLSDLCHRFARLVNQIITPLLLIENFVLSEDFKNYKSGEHINLFLLTMQPNPIHGHSLVIGQSTESRKCESILWYPWLKAINYNSAFQSHRQS